MESSSGLMGTISAEDRRLLRRAVELGRRGWGRVQPNPLVGCVIVKDGEVVGEGWHQEFGGPHAEVVALAMAAGDAAGATAYVSLEPCRHQGKTPPCARALVAAGISRVLFGAADPGERSGGGGEALREMGVEVVGPLLTPREAQRENPGFFRKDRRPWVALKLAISLDGKISSRPGQRSQISGAESDEEVHRLRAGFDAILVGSNTARVDDPLLTVRGDILAGVPPRRVILDTTGKVSPASSVLEPGGGPVIFLTSGASSREWRDGVRARGGSVVELPAERGGVSLSSALEVLRLDGARTILCEGGGVLGAGLLHAGLVDRLYLIVAPRLIGPGGVPALPLEEAPPQAGPLSPDWEQIREPRRVGDDTWITLEPVGA